jgi:hypothetical protein
MGNHWYPEGTGVLITTQDGLLDLADISWQTIAPCGCVCGFRMGAVGDEILVVTAEQAARGMCENDLAYQRDVELGFTWRAREHRAAVEELKSACPHTPTWGVPVIPVPDGFAWAAVHCLGATPKLKHLVPRAAVDAAAARSYDTGHTKPLCGGRDAFWWKDAWYALTGKVECKRCAAKATKLAETAVPA